MTTIVDTNVILVANRQHAQVSEKCIVACVEHLKFLMENGRIAIDDGYRILGEYQNKTTPRVGKRAGDVFLKWLLRNNANPSRCDLVNIVDHDERGFVTFPDDARLETFDPSDRKFVAVAGAHSDRPPISQAADSKWLRWSPFLADHGITVDFLCPDELSSFADNKTHKGTR